MVDYLVVALNQLGWRVVFVSIWMEEIKVELPAFYVVFQFAFRIDAGIFDDRDGRV